LFALANIRGTDAELTFRGADVQPSKGGCPSIPSQHGATIYITASDTLITVQVSLKPLGFMFPHIICNPFTKLATIVSRSNKIGEAFVVRSAGSCSIKIQAFAVLAQHFENADFTRVAKKRRRIEESRRSWKTAAPSCRDEEAELLVWAPISWSRMIGVLCRFERGSANVVVKEDGRSKYEAYSRLMRKNFRSTFLPQKLASIHTPGAKADQPRCAIHKAHCPPSASLGRL
jgi:hypothetical protein